MIQRRTVIGHRLQHAAVLLYGVQERLRQPGVLAKQHGLKFDGIHNVQELEPRGFTKSPAHQRDEFFPDPETFIAGLRFRR